jgi:hypothetical protein
MADQTKVTKELVKQFSEDLEQELDAVLTRKLGEVISSQFEPVYKRLDNLDRLITMLLEGFNDDRKDIGLMKANQEAIKAYALELLDASNRQIKVITGKVTFEIAKMTDKVQDQAKEGSTKAVESFLAKKGSEVEEKPKEKRSWNPLKWFK